MSPRLRRRTATFEQDLTSPEYDGFAPVLLLVLLTRQSSSTIRGSTQMPGSTRSLARAHGDATRFAHASSTEHPDPHLRTEGGVRSLPLGRIELGACVVLLVAVLVARADR